LRLRDGKGVLTIRKKGGKGEVEGGYCAECRRKKRGVHKEESKNRLSRRGTFLSAGREEGRKVILSIARGFQRRSEKGGQASYLEGGGFRQNNENAPILKRGNGLLEELFGGERKLACDRAGAT